MKKLLIIAITALAALNFAPAHARASSASRIAADSRAALHDLYAVNPKARMLGKHAVAVLVFPSITKGGFVVAAQHGEGALITHNGIAGYYNSVAASYGFQAGIQKFGYAVFFMKNPSNYLNKQGGWSLGSAPSLVVVDSSIASSLSTDNLNKDVYALFFNRLGLMGGLGLQGSKITEIHPR
jgi:lipid-binding SYLF domain-containing protein